MPDAIMACAKLTSVITSFVEPFDHPLDSFLTQSEFYIGKVEGGILR